jgi:Holliday junction resolvasome RuvABC endonuclease subunit
VRILALDLGTHTGWAACGAHGSGVESGVQTFALLRGESPGMRYLRFRRWLSEMLGLWQPTVVAYEQTHMRGGAATEIAAGFSTRVQELCAERGLEHVPVHSSRLKKHATGRGVADKPSMQRAAITRWGLGTVPTEDEADALCVLAWALDECGDGREP